MRYGFGLVALLVLSLCGSVSAQVPGQGADVPTGGPVNTPQLNITGNMVLGGVGAGGFRLSDSIIFFSGSVTGTCNNAGANCPLVDIVTNTGVVSVGASAAEGIRCLTFLRAAQNGNYICGDFQTQLIETTAGSNTNKNYIGLNAAFIASASDLGNGFAIGTFCNVLTGVTVTTCTGAEADLAIVGGGTPGHASYQYGWAVLMEGINGTAASLDSAAFALGLSTGGTATLSCALCSGYSGGASPLAATADFIAHHGAGTKPSITNFLNFSGWTASNYQILLADGTSGFSAFGSLLFAAGRQIAFVGGATLDGPAAATLRLGSVDAAGVPVAQTISVQNVAAGQTNTAGANATIAGSLSTGSGLGGLINFNISQSIAAATTQNTGVTRFSVGPSGAKFPIVAVASLPTCNGTNEGSNYAVNDALAPAFLTTIAGGGAVHTAVYCDGTNWKAL